MTTFATILTRLDSVLDEGAYAQARELLARLWQAAGQDDGLLLLVQTQQARLLVGENHLAECKRVLDRIERRLQQNAIAHDHAALVWRFSHAKARLAQRQGRIMPALRLWLAMLEQTSLSGQVRAMIDACLGYGDTFVMVGLPEQAEQAHRYAYELARGDAVPANVRFRCGLYLCNDLLAQQCFTPLQALLPELAALSDQQHNPYWQVDFLVIQARAALARTAETEALALAEQAHAQAAHLGYLWGQQAAGSTLAHVLAHTGQLHSARDLLAAAITRCEAHGGYWPLGLYEQMHHLHEQCGDAGQALRCFETYHERRLQQLRDEVSQRRLLGKAQHRILALQLENLFLRNRLQRLESGSRHGG